MQRFRKKEYALQRCRAYLNNGERKTRLEPADAGRAYGPREIHVTPSPLRGGPLGGQGSLVGLVQNKNANHKGWRFVLERKTRLELATPTLARSCSTN